MDQAQAMCDDSSENYFLLGPFSPRQHGGGIKEQDINPKRIKGGGHNGVF